MSFPLLLTPQRNSIPRKLKLVFSRYFRNRLKLIIRLFSSANSRLNFASLSRNFRSNISAIPRISEYRYKIIGKTDEISFSVTLLFNFPFKPKVQYIVEINVCQYGTDDSSLGCALYRFEDSSSSATAPALSHFLINRLIVPSPDS